MKKLILSLAVLSVALVTAQKKEIANAVKAIEMGNASSANTELTKAEAIFGDKTYLLEPAVLEQYYYAKGAVLIKEGKTLEGAEVLAKINNLAEQPIFTGKDASKNKVYFVGKATADQLGRGIDLKQEKYAPLMKDKVAALTSSMYSKTYESAISNYNEKKFAAAAEDFKVTYYLMNAAGVPDESILLNAGIAYTQAEKPVQAAEIYKQLLDNGYTGVKTSYTALNIANNQVDNLPKSTFDTLKKLGDASGYKDFKVVQSESVEGEIYETYLRLLIQNKNYDEVLNVSNIALKKFPTNNNIVNIRGLAYYNSGKSNEYIDILKSQLEKNPNDTDSWYNLGVMLSNDPTKISEAEDAYKKVISINATYPNALSNLIYSIIGEDDKAINQYKDLRKEGKIEAANKVLEQRRIRFQKALPYAEQLYAQDPNNKVTVTLLKNFYMATQNTSKYNEMKAKEETMK